MISRTKIGLLAAGKHRFLSGPTFLRNVALIAGSSLFAQALRLLISPVLSRLYTPADFGVFGIFASVTSGLFVASSFRYDFAITIPKSDDDGARLLFVSLIAACLTSVAIACISYALYATAVIPHDIAHIELLLALVPIGIAAMAVYSSLNYWALRTKAFSTVSKTHIVQGIGSSIIQVAAGFLLVGPFGLMFGRIVGRSAGIGSLARHARTVLNGFRHQSTRALRETALRYADLASSSTVSVIFSAGARYSAPVIIAMCYGAETAGHFALAERIITAPMGFLGHAFSKVYLSEAASLASNGKVSDLKRLFGSTSLKLFLIALVPAVILLLFSVPLFVRLFGSQWTLAGRFAQVMVPMTIMVLIGSPLSQTLNIIERHRDQVKWEALRLVFVGGAIPAAYFFNQDAVTSVLIYAIMSAAAYGGMLWWSYRRLQHH